MLPVLAILGCEKATDYELVVTFYICGSPHEEWA